VPEPISSSRSPYQDELQLDSTFPTVCRACSLMMRFERSRSLMTPNGTSWTAKMSRAAHDQRLDVARRPRLGKVEPAEAARSTSPAVPRTVAGGRKDGSGWYMIGPLSKAKKSSRDGDRTLCAID
jgi:hypothetical protein